MIAAKFRIMTIEQRAVRGTAENFVICDTQKSYSENLFRRLSEKLSGYFQFHVFHDIENLKIAAKSMQVNILLIGEEYGKEDRDEIPARQKYLLIGEKIPNERSPTEIPFFRYQSVSSMLELLLQEKDQENSEVQTHQIQLVSDRSQTVKANVNGLIGIYSPVHRIGKTRFAMRMGRVLSESIPTLYLNLEGYSGLNYYLPEESGMNLGDLLYYMKQESINPVWKISTLISHMNGVDYIAPIRAEQDFREVTKEEWNQLLDLILEKSIYKVIILDLGDTVDGLYDLLGRNSDTETLKSIARKNLCQLSTLRWQQMDGLHTALPFGPRKINALRTLTTESTAVLIPFHTQEIMQEGGIYYGQNAVSKNMIVVDRKKLLNGNSFRLGVSGSGKSFSAKEEIVALALATEDDILILDPESEFGNLTVALGGEVVKVSATSGMHLNAMDMDSSYGDDTNPLIEKSEFLLSVFEQLIGAGNLGAKDKSIIDRCTADTYRDYIRSGYTKEVPTLKDLYRQLMLQEEPEARALALSAELFTSGSLNTFAHKTNVDTKNRIMDYDIRELGSQLMPLGMLVTLDAIFNRVIQNWKKGKRTWIFCDEFYLLFRYPYSAEFFYKLWKRIRKYNGFVNAMSQNVDEVLRSDTARLMLANSEFLVMLNQASTDREELARLLNISDNQLGYITNVKAGSGLIRCSGNLVPFENTFPRNTKLYQLMTTKPGESLKAV